MITTQQNGAEPPLWQDHDGGRGKRRWGSRDTPPGVVHRDSTTAYRAVIGLDCDPADMTRPIDKEPALLP
jgi:hypothetical protein